MDTGAQLAVFMVVAPVAALCIAVYLEKKRLDQQDQIRDRVADVLIEKMTIENEILREGLKRLSKNKPP
jgi:hypothetical protein